MDQTKLKEQWDSRVTDFKASGQTMKAWCAAKSLTIHQLKYWLRKTSDSDSQDPTPAKSKWLSLAVSGSVTETRPSNSLIIRIGQSSIEVRADFDAVLLRQVVRALEVSC